MKIVYSESAKKDLKDIYGYIADKLKAPKAARNISEKIMDKIDSLHDMALVYPVYDKEPLRSMNLRYVFVGKYGIFYFADEAEETVEIVRIMHGSRDIEKRLTE